ETVADFKVAMAGSQLVFTVLPTTTAAGAAITPAVQVTVQDGLGNTVTSFSGTVTVTLGANPGPGTLAGHTTVAAVNGVATYANLTIDKAGVGYTLKATAPPLPAAPSVAFDIRAGAPAKLAIVTQPPASARSGEVFAQQPVIQLQDANGNPVSQAGVVVTASVASGSPTATLVGSSATTNAAGRAPFLGLPLTGPSGSYTLSFSAPNLAAVTSTPVALGAGTAATIARNAGGTAAQVGTAVQPPPSVIVKDGSGNPVAGVAVTFATAAGNGTVTPTTAVSTDATGIAAITSWVLGTTVRTDTLTAAAAGLQGSPVTFTATATVGGAASLKVSSGDNLTGMVGTQLQTPHVVVVADANGNPVSGIAVTWAAGTGGGSVAPASSTTDANGHAQ